MSTRPDIFVTGLGVVCAGAKNVAELRALLARPERHFQCPTTVFSTSGESRTLPVAQATGLDDDGHAHLPRTHRLAIQAGCEAVGQGPAVDAIVLGTTTGGILATELALQAGEASPLAYRFHGLTTVAEELATILDVRGPVLTLSTACSSAAVALTVASALLRTGRFRRVLSGGVDSLARLTFHGFRQLQLIAPQGAMPLDIRRAGLTVGEGAGFLLLETQPDDRPVFALLTGGGLSCDAFHATRPHPEGEGAVAAMRLALADAGLAPTAIDYINLHGTGTVDNDAAEALAIHRVFGTELPSLSSTKGMTGHALAAAGAIEAVISVLTLSDGLVPANTGLVAIDPALHLDPVRTPTRARVQAVLSNSLGFGGNNASLVFEEAALPPPLPATWSGSALPAARIMASACLTAAGDLDQTWRALSAGEKVAGRVPEASFDKAVPAAFVRRLKRLPRLVLALAQTAHVASGRNIPPDTISLGTAWGPLAETRDFLRKLFETEDRFSSPTDFIGSVHNAPAGQVALLLGAHGPNLTCSAGDRSFGQALLCALLGIGAGAGSALVLAAEAHQEHLSPLLDPVAATSPLASDGGAALVLGPDDGLEDARVRWLAECDVADVASCVAELAGPSFLHIYDVIAVGISVGVDAEKKLSELQTLIPAIPCIAYRDRLGQHASVSATATAIIARAVNEGVLPLGKDTMPLPHRRVLLLQLGTRAELLEVFA
jgi:3-oxoacyl-(acyl-carrier-protein) synthase